MIRLSTEAELALMLATNTPDGKTTITCSRAVMAEMVRALEWRLTQPNTTPAIIETARRGIATLSAVLAAHARTSADNARQGEA